MSKESVRLRGSVTLAPGSIPEDPYDFYFQDSTGGISVGLARRLELTLNNLVEVTGRCGMYDELEVEVTAEDVRLLERRAPVQPRSITVAEAAAGRHEGELVRVRGTVLSASVGETRDRLQIGDGKDSVGVYIRRPLDHPSVLVQMAPPDSVVEVDGILILTSKKLYQVRMRTNRDLHLVRSPRTWFMKNLPAILAVLGLMGGFSLLWIVSMQRTLRKKTAQIRQLLEQARAASELKSQFLANVSHEIRTPIHGILGLQSLLLETPLREDQREQLRIANEATLSLRALLDDLLDLSRIEAGRLHLAPEPFSPALLLGQCTEQFAARASEKGVALRTRLSADLPRTVSADVTRLRQVLTNLVSNAVKFTAEGEVVVSAEVVERGNQRERIRFAVRDTGIGIAPEELSHIFESFRQADGSISRRYGGSGLGLSIASRLAALMGSRIEVESRLHEGTEFRLDLDLPVLEEAAAPEDVEMRQDCPSALRVLLAEDNPVNQLVALRLLEKDRHKVAVAGSGKEAVEQFRSGEFDVVLMDVQMPEMDGLEATRIIRAMESERARTVPIIALSAHTMKAESDKCLEVGMDDFLGKPFQRDELRAVLRRAVTPPGAAVKSGSAPAQDHAVL